MTALVIGSEQQGDVVTFDEHVGLGEIRVSDGTTLPFHCTQIADGTRTIATGIRVRFTVRAGGPGRWEAFGVRPC